LFYLFNENYKPLSGLVRLWKIQDRKTSLLEDSKNFFLKKVTRKIKISQTRKLKEIFSLQKLRFPRKTNFKKKNSTEGDRSSSQNFFCGVIISSFFSELLIFFFLIENFRFFFFFSSQKH